MKGLLSLILAAATGTATLIVWPFAAIVWLIYNRENIKIWHECNPGPVNNGIRASPEPDNRIWHPQRKN